MEDIPLPDEDYAGPDYDSFEDSAPAPDFDTPLKVVPHSIEAEQAVLGGLMLATGDQGNAWDMVSDVLGVSDFYRADHRLLFETMAGLIAAEQPIDVVTVADQLQAKGELDRAGGLPYLAELADNTPSTANIRAYATIVREKATLRQLITTASDIVDRAYDSAGQSSDELLESAENNILRIRDDRPNEGGPQYVNPVLEKTLTQIDELFHSDSAITGVTTGFERLDEMTSGLQRSNLVIVAGRPSMGKTTFAMNLVENAMLAVEKPVVVFSMEMPAEDIVKRMIGSLGRIDVKNVFSGKLTEEDWPKLSTAVRKMKDKPLFIDDSTGLSPTEIRARLRRIQRERGDIGMVMVDYLQLMKINGFSEGRTAEISEISRGLKSVAREFNCPVVALSQLNRSLEQRPNKRPINSDLRESGAIEQDADVIMFIYRDEVYNEDTDQKGVAEIIIGKQRNGPIGTCKLAFVNRYTRFENLAIEYQDEY